MNLVAKMGLDAGCADDRRGSGSRGRLRSPRLLALAALMLAGLLSEGCGGGPSAENNVSGEAPQRRVVVLGFDGVDPNFLRQWMDQLPHLKKLTAEGSFKSLRTTTPPASCTAWMSFATGLDPGAHGMFDFIFRDPATYLPDRAGAVPHKAEYLWRLFEKKPETFTTTTSGEPFWKRLDEAGKRSVVLRVPCVFPLAPMTNGNLEGGFGVPDIRGSEGTFHYFTSELTPHEAADPALGGKVVSVGRGPVVETAVEGPVNPLAENYERLSVPLTIRVKGTDAVELALGSDTHTVRVGEWSPWFRMAFKVTPFSTIRGTARFRVIEIEPELKVFMSPINHDPADPAIALTEPPGYSRYLFEAVGDHKTVGWNHETWGLNEERIDEDAFMEDIFDTMRQTEEITFRELDGSAAELFVSVFVETDRTSHMMYRLIDSAHPRYDAELASRHGDAILRTYRRMDEIVGKVMSRLGEQDTLIVMSDHGFHSWRRGFNVNTWLVQQGFMTLKNGAKYTDKKFLLDVDWSRTRAYAMGVGAVYINLRGREGRGVVSRGAEYDALVREISEGLKAVVDPATGTRAIAGVYLASETWRGARIADAQDLQIGFAPGYRVSSATPLGGVPEELFEDNMKKWSGDHAATLTEITDGVLISNRRISDERVSIVDIAPTILDLLGVPVPPEYDGKIFRFVDAATGTQ
ncbi:MAG: alkaline phosphatase family protein [Candidatus Binatia bacterium]